LVSSNYLDFYLALLSLQMAILGFVLAGVMALMQMLQSARPRRQTELLISRAALGLYVGFMVLLLGGLSLATWLLAFEPEWRTARVFMDSGVAGMLLIAILAALAELLVLIMRARRLLNDDDYIDDYMATIDPETVRDYLFKLHAARPTENDQLIAAWEQRYQRVKQLTDPFQPVREYIKACASRSYDYGTAKGLNLLGEYVGETYEAMARQPEPEEFYRLALYLHDATEEFFILFAKLGPDKRKAGIIKLVHTKAQLFLQTPHSEGLITAIRGLEHLARSGADEGEIIMCVERIGLLTNEYIVAADAQDLPWSEVGTVFEECCVSMARLAEAYYLQSTNPLHAIPMLSHKSGEYHTVTAALVEFFRSFVHLADRFNDTYPERYFDSIEAVAEVLLTRYAEIAETAQEKVGVVNVYQQLARQLYGIYASVGTDAIEHHKPELLALAVANLEQIGVVARQLGLPKEQKAVKVLLGTLRKA
jgi:hypothetical protein